MNVFLNPHIELSQQKQSNEDETHQNEDEGTAGRGLDSWLVLVKKSSRRHSASLGQWTQGDCYTGEVCFTYIIQQILRRYRCVFHLRYVLKNTSLNSNCTIGGLEEFVPEASTVCVIFKLRNYEPIKLGH